eukprot:scaffold1714_cov78-Skeletonema_dohrnii-CCMP3373.AAC.3
MRMRTLCMEILMNEASFYDLCCIFSTLLTDLLRIRPARKANQANHKARSIEDSSQSRSRAISDSE